MNASQRSYNFLARVKCKTSPAYLSVSVASFHSRAGEAERSGEAQHVAELRSEEGIWKREHEPCQSGRHLRHG